MEQEGASPATRPPDAYSRAVGDYGGKLLDYLCAERQNAEPFLVREEWQPGDSQGLEQWLALEDSLLLMPLSANLDSEAQVRRFHDATRTFHEHLPYSEPERDWLVETALFQAARSQAGRFKGASLPERFYVEESITAAGLLRVVSGRDLMRRWLSWRAETDEFTRQAVMGCARDSLCDLIELVLPCEPLPESYRSLVQRPSSA
jgi:hypothetical protein